MKNKDTENLSERQLDAARMIAMNPDRTKESIAESLKISRRTVFRWLQNVKFVEKINEFKQSAIASIDVFTIAQTLSNQEKEKLLEILKMEQEPDFLPEIYQLEERILEVTKDDDIYTRKLSKRVMIQLALMMGRLNRSILSLSHYNQDGTPHYKDRLDKILWYLHFESLKADLCEKPVLKAAIVEASKLLKETMKNSDETPDPGYDFDFYSGLSERVYDDAIDKYYPGCEQEE